MMHDECSSSSDTSSTTSTSESSYVPYKPTNRFLSIEAMRTIVLMDWSRLRQIICKADDSFSDAKQWKAMFEKDPDQPKKWYESPDFTSANECSYDRLENWYQHPSAWDSINIRKDEKLEISIYRVADQESPPNETDVMVCTGVADRYGKRIDKLNSVMLRGNIDEEIHSGLQFASSRGPLKDGCFMTQSEAGWNTFDSVQLVNRFYV